MITIKKNSDPFKKYWWVILLSFAAVGGWLCIPILDSGTGGGVALRERDLKSAQSLDSIANPAGAPGSAVDLSMEGSGAYAKKVYEGKIGSSLYQAPPEEPAAAAAPQPAPNNFADALKMISSKKAPASMDKTGWGGEAAQKGFTPPHANFGSMSGLGGGGGSSGAAASVAGSGGAGMPALTPFGSEGPRTGVSFTKGLKNEPAAGAGKGAAGALQNASSQMVAAANQGSADKAVNMAQGVFDGGGGRGGIGGEGAATGGGAGLYGSMDAAPINLKVNDPKLNSIKIEPPAHKEVPPAPPDMKQRIMEMIIMMVVGGVVNGVIGGVMGSVFGGKGGMFNNPSTPGANMILNKDLPHVAAWRRHGIAEIA